MKKKSSKQPTFREGIALNKRAFDLWRQAHPMLFVSSAFYKIVSSLTPYVGIYLSAQIINELAGSRNPQVLKPLVLITLISTVFLSLLIGVLDRWKNCQYYEHHYKRQKIYMDKMLDMDFCSLDDQKTHDLRSQIRQNEQWNGWGIERILYYFDSGVGALFSIAGAIALTVSLFTNQVPSDAGKLVVLNHPLFAALLVLLLLFFTLASPVFSNMANQYWARSAEDSKLGNRFFGFFGFLAMAQHRATDIRMYRQEIICRHYLKKNKSFTPDSKIAQYAKGPMGVLNALSGLVSTVFTGLVYIFVCLKAWGGAFGVGSVTQYIGAITALSQGVANFMSILGDMKNNTTFLRTTFEFLDIPNDMYQGSLTTEKRSDRKYLIEFQDVSFKYPSSDTYALQHVSLKFHVGERLAVVGMNGSGKTTFIKLLCRLYDPTEGVILLNGIDIRKYDYDDYLSIFSVVFQDFKLLSFTLGQNVAANVDYDDNRVASCLEKAGFSDRLKSMPEGLETVLYRDFSDKGVSISGGEAQKIALARALYKNAPFMILDEPTAALDPIAEYEVYTKFNEIVGDKTAIYISHRLASCRFCDHIVVFHEGNIVQEGSHKELVEDEKGLYHELWHAQAQYYQ